MPIPKKHASFVEPMECLPVSTLPEGSKWLWELKLDGYRAIAVKSGQKVRLYSRNQKPFDKKFPHITEALRNLKDETTIDGEIVALDDAGRPSFNLLQNFVSEAGRVRYFVFDILHHKGRDQTGLELIERRKIFRFAIEAANFHLFECTAYMFRHAVPGPLCIQGTPSLKSTCAETQLHKPSGVAATDWQACRGSFSTLPTRL